MAEHTPTPWRSMHQYLMTAKGPLPIASGYHDYVTTPTGTMHQEAVANAEFIAKAVNNHEALVAALKESRAALIAFKDAVEASQKMNGREYVGLGIQINNAIGHAWNVLADVGGEKL